MWVLIVRAENIKFPGRVDVLLAVASMVVWCPSEHPGVCCCKSYPVFDKELKLLLTYCIWIIPLNQSDLSVDMYVLLN